MTVNPSQNHQRMSDRPLAFIIEDDPKLANIFAEALRQAGYKAESILDGCRAMERLADTIPAMVVLDIHLPHYSGTEILQQIRADTRLAQTRVILATADALRADQLWTEADLVLLKPVGYRQLRDLAERYRPKDLAEGQDF